MSLEGDINFLCKILPRLIKGVDKIGVELEQIKKYAKMEVERTAQSVHSGPPLDQEIRVDDELLREG